MKNQRNEEQSKPSMKKKITYPNWVSRRVSCNRFKLCRL